MTVVLNENMQKFVAALRSGEFQQAKGTLTRLQPPAWVTEAINSGDEKRKADALESDDAGVGYCCLGVASECAYRDGVVQKRNFPSFGLERGGEVRVIYGTDLDTDEEESSYTFLPPPVAKWLGLPDGQTDLYFDMTGTEVDNDDNLTSWGRSTKVRNDGRLVVQASTLNDKYSYTFSQLADLIESDRMVEKTYYAV